MKTISGVKQEAVNMPLKKNAKELTPEQEAQVDYDSLKWRFGQPGVHQ